MFKTTRFIGALVVFALICVITASNGYAIPEGDINSTVSPQHKLSADELKRTGEATNVIIIQGAGEFRRVSSVPKVNTNEIVYSKDLKLITKKTKVLVLDYGIFEKVKDLD
jgi:hypothetical protein